MSKLFMNIKHLMFMAVLKPYRSYASIFTILGRKALRLEYTAVDSVNTYE